MSKKKSEYFIYFWVYSIMDIYINEISNQFSLIFTTIIFQKNFTFSFKILFIKRVFSCEKLRKYEIFSSLCYTSIIMCSTFYLQKRRHDMLRFKNMTKTYGGRKKVAVNISFYSNDMKFIAFIGTSLCG